MTFLEAAAEVLRSAKRPLTAAEITQIALSRELLKTKGKTPEATMSARLYGAGPTWVFRREYDKGPGKRARRGSVRWSYSGVAMPSKVPR